MDTLLHKYGKKIKWEFLKCCFFYVWVCFLFGWGKGLGRKFRELILHCVKKYAPPEFEGAYCTLVINQFSTANVMVGNDFIKLPSSLSSILIVIVVLPSILRLRRPVSLHVATAWFATMYSINGST